MGAAKFLRFHSLQLFYFYLFRKQFHPWRATWRHDNWVLPNSSVAISGNYFTFIFSENNFIREERLDVTTTECCQVSPLPFLAIILLLSFPKTISSVKSDLTSRQQGAAKLLRCHFTQLLYFYLSRKQFQPWRSTWRHAKWVLPNFFVSIPCNYFTFTFSENNFIHEEQLDVPTTGSCQTSPLPFLAMIFSENNFIREERLDVPTTGSCQTSTLPFLAMIFSENNFIRQEQLDVTTTGSCQTSTLPFLAMIFSENIFIREEQLDVTTTGCCQTSTLPSLSITLLSSFPETSSSVKSELTSRQLGAAKLLRCHCWQLFYFYLFRKNFVGEERLDVTTTGCCQTSTLPFLAITLLLSFPKISSSVKSDLTSRQLGAAKLLRCHFWLWSFPKTISSVKSNLTSRQLGAAKLLRCHFWLWSFPKTFSSMKSNLTSRQLGAARLLRCHFCQLLYFHLFRKHLHPWRATWRHDNWVLPNFYVAIAGYDLFRKQFHPSRATWRHDNWELPNFYVAISGYDLFRKHFHPWRATWRHDNWVLPDFYVAISVNYFTFIFSGNIFIREERLDVTTTGCCQTSRLPLLAIILLLSFPKTISSVKSDLTSRQLGAAKLLRCHFWQLLYFYLFRKLLHPWRATWRPDNWELPNFYVAISGYDLFRKQFHPSWATWRHDNWELPNFYVAISGYDFFRKNFHPWRATWRHDNWVLPDFYVAISVNYFTFIFSGNIFIREERLDVTTTGCCQASTLPLLAMIFSENNFIREGRLDVTTTGCCQTSPLPFHSITLLLSFPKTISSVKSDLTSR